LEQSQADEWARQLTEGADAFCDTFVSQFSPPES
jgi:hypothetical protein